MPPETSRRHPKAAPEFASGDALNERIVAHGGDISQPPRHTGTVTYDGLSDGDPAQGPNGAPELPLDADVAGRSVRQ